jgi:uncharacterized surface protein with fasciclin (FAS1) repeats
MPFARITLVGAVSALALSLNMGFAGAASAQPNMEDPMVGGVAMYPSKNIVENAANAPDLSTLVVAMKAAGVVQTLQGPGPFTVFAPTNGAFEKLPPGAIDALMQQRNDAQLIRLLSYHVVAGRLTTSDLVDRINAGNGRATLTTTIGEPLYASLTDGRIILTDVHGGTAMVVVPNVYQSNGVVQVVNSVLTP